MTDLTELNGEETRVILDQITELVEKLHDATYSIGDIDKGKVVWPPKEDMSHADALATCFDFADGELTLSFRSLGNELEEEEDEVKYDLCVSWQGSQAFEDSPNGCYGVQPLKKMLQDLYDLHVEEGYGEAETGSMLSRLIKAFDEPA